MAFRGMMARLGSGGAGVETVLDRPETTPGGSVTGTVHVTGGTVPQDVTEVRVALQATVEVESGDSSWREEVTFGTVARSEEHTSELQSRQYLVCRLLLEK